MSSFARLELEHWYPAMPHSQPPPKSGQPIMINIEPETLLFIVVVGIFIPLIVVGFFAR